MANFFAYKYSTSHYFFPKIIIAVLIILALIIFIPKIVKVIKNKQNPFKGKRFFEENFDKVKLFGSIILFVLYILALEWIHFLAASLIFIFLFNVLYSGFRLKSLIVSGTITAISVVVVWFIFGVAFNVTLP